MTNTYSQLYLHLIFAVNGRRNLIGSQWKDQLYKYITGIISNKKQKLMIINGMQDHIHILISFSPDCIISYLVRDIKANSSRWINENRFLIGKFGWQEGFGAFSVSPSQVQRVVNYILNQEEHHKKQSFREEFMEILEAYKIEYNPDYIPIDYGVDTDQKDG